MTKIAFIIEKFIDSPLGGEPAIHLNCIKHFLSRNYFIDIFCEHNLSQENSFNVYSEFSKNKEPY